MLKLRKRAYKLHRDWKQNWFAFIMVIDYWQIEEVKGNDIENNASESSRCCGEAFTVFRAAMTKHEAIKVAQRGKHDGIPWHRYACHLASS